MAQDPAFLFYPGDYLKDTQCLNEKSQVAYDRIMCEHMRNICITYAQFNFFTKSLNDEEKNDLIHVLKKVDGGYCIDWVAESISKRRSYSQSRRNNRNSAKKNICQTYDPHMLTHDEHMIDISKTYDRHMENENANENKDKGKGTENLLRGSIWEGVRTELPPLPPMAINRDNLKDYLKQYKENDEDLIWFARDTSLTRQTVYYALLHFNYYHHGLKSEWPNERELRSHIKNYITKKLASNPFEFNKKPLPPKGFKEEQQPYDKDNLSPRLRDAQEVWDRYEEQQRKIAEQEQGGGHE